MKASRKRYFWDLSERALNTVWQSAVAALPLTYGVADLHGFKGIGMEMLAGALGGASSVLKGLIATKVGDSDTAALLSAAADTPEPERPRPRPARD